MLCCIQISIILNFSKINICLLMNILSFILSIATRRCGSTWNDALSFNAASLPSTLRRTAVRLSKNLASILYDKIIIVIRIAFPIQRIISNIVRDIIKFRLISDYMVMVIRLPQWIVFIEFWDVYI